MKKGALSRFSGWMLAAALSLAAGFAVFGTLYAQGFWDESQAVHIVSGNIETSTLAVGTHLIHLSALNDSLYEVALSSAEESGQTRVYYKSELGGNAWFDITNATSLSDITDGGTPLTDEEIEALFFTHHTKSDKVTYDLRTNTPVSIFDIRDPYELESMEELMPLKMYYDQLVQQEGDEEIIERIDAVWQTNIQPQEVKDMDAQLAALQQYLNVLTDNDADATETDKVSSVMEAVDAGRRYAVFDILENTLSDYLDELGGSAADPEPAPAAEGEEGETEEEEEEEEDEEKDPPPQELLSAVSESLGNVQGALIEHSGKMLDEGTTVMSAAAYRFSNSLVADAESENHAACDADVRDLLLLDHIQNDVIADRPAELALIESQLLPEASSRYQSALSAGESAAYRAEVAKQSAQALLNRFISESEGEMETCRGELEFLVSARCTRLDNEAAMAFIDERLRITTASLMPSVPQDAFYDAASASAEEHVVFLTNKKRSLELSLGGNEMDQLVAEKEALQEEYLQALDNNDLTAAQEIASQREALEEEIQALEAENAAQLQQLAAQADSLPEGSAAKAAAEAELMALESSQSDGSLGAAVADLKSAALEGDAAAAQSLAEMASAAPALVLPALQEVYNDLLLNGGGSQELVDAIESAILNNPTALKEELSAADIRRIAEDYLRDAAAGETGLLDAGTGTGTGSGAGAGVGTGSGAGLLDAGDASAGGASGTGAGTGTGTLPGGTGSGVPGFDVPLTDAAGEPLNLGGEGSGSEGETGTGATGLSGAEAGAVPGLPGMSGTGAGAGTGLPGTGSGAPGADGTGSGLPDAGETGTAAGAGVGSAADALLLGTGGLTLAEAKNQAAVIVALQLYAEETGNPAAVQVLAAKAQEQVNLGNPLVYSRVVDGGREYVPLDSLQTLTGYRYVWERNASLGTLARGADFYGFTLYSNQVKRDRAGEKTEQMTGTAQYQGVLHIPEGYAWETFGVQTVYLSGSRLACAADAEIVDMAQELFDQRLMQ